VDGTNTNTKIEELVHDIEQLPRLNYRLMLRRSDGKWLLQAMVADMHASASAPFVYNYGEVAFIGTFGNGTRPSDMANKKKGADSWFQIHSSKNTWQCLQLSPPEPHSAGFISQRSRTLFNSPDSY
jgi:hypothetical protein